MANGALEQSSTAMIGTIHVKVNKITGLPVKDFSKEQDAYVSIYLATTKDATSEISRTDAVPRKGKTLELLEEHNRDLELYYDGKTSKDSVILAVDVWLEDFCHNDNKIGTGTIDIMASIKSGFSETYQSYTVQLKDYLGGSEYRGEVSLSVSFGPPLRPAVRAAQKSAELLRIRDAFVRSLYATRDCIQKCAWSWIEGPANMICEQVLAHKKVTMVLLAFIAATITAIVGIAAAAAIPVSILLLVTLPFWILPIFFGSLLTAPLWLPIVFFIGILLFGIFLLCMSLGLTSQVVRRKGSLLATKVKISKVGKKVLYA